MKPFNLENDDKINSGFKTPDGYFEQFETKIMHQISEKDVKVISIFQKSIFYISTIAAVFVIGLCTTLYIQSIDIEINNEYLAFENTITNEDIIEHLSDNDIAILEETLDLYDIDTKKYAKEYLY